MRLKSLIALAATEAAELAEIVISHAAVRAFELDLLDFLDGLAEIRQTRQQICQAELLFHLHALLPGAVFAQMHLRDLFIHALGQMHCSFFFTKVAFHCFLMPPHQLLFKFPPPQLVWGLIRPFSTHTGSLISYTI